jgi:phage gp37-like protein
MDELFDEKEVIAVSTVWQQFFGKPGNGGSKTVYSPFSDVIEIDIMRGNERVAALIHRGTDSRFLDLQRNTATQNFSSFSIQMNFQPVHID